MEEDERPSNISGASPFSASRSFSSDSMDLDGDSKGNGEEKEREMAIEGQGLRDAVRSGPVLSEPVESEDDMLRAAFHLFSNNHLVPALSKLARLQQ